MYEQHSWSKCNGSFFNKKFVESVLSFWILNLSLEALLQFRLFLLGLNDSIIIDTIFM